VIRLRNCIGWAARAVLSCAIPIFIPSAQAQLTPAQPAASQEDSAKTQVKVNYLNVCNPSEEEQHELGAALARLPLQSKFAPDFEVSRGRTTMNEPPVKLEGMEAEPSANSGPPPISNWVRLRREFPPNAAFVSAQYSFSVDEKNIVETLVFRSREAKDVIETSLEDKISAVAEAGQALKSDSPVDRIRIERFGKPSIVLARCSAADQSVYEPLFQKSSEIMARYRSLLAVRQTVPADLRRLGVGANPAARPSPRGKRVDSKSTLKPKPAAPK